MIQYFKEFCHGNDCIWPACGNVWAVLRRKFNRADKYDWYPGDDNWYFNMLCGVSCSIFCHYVYCILCTLFEGTPEGEKILFAFEKGEQALSRGRTDMSPAAWYSTTGGIESDWLIGNKRKD